MTGSVGTGLLTTRVVSVLCAITLGGTFGIFWYFARLWRVQPDAAFVAWDGSPAQNLLSNDRDNLTKVLVGGGTSSTLLRGRRVPLASRTARFMKGDALCDPFSQAVKLLCEGALALPALQIGPGRQTDQALDSRDPKQDAWRRELIVARGGLVARDPRGPLTAARQRGRSAGRYRSGFVFPGPADGR